MQEPRTAVLISSSDGAPLFDVSAKNSAIFLYAVCANIDGCERSEFENSILRGTCCGPNKPKRWLPFQQCINEDEALMYVRGARMPDASRGGEEFTMYAINLLYTGDRPGVATTFSTKESASATLFCDQCKVEGEYNHSICRNMCTSAGESERRTKEDYFRDTAASIWPEKNELSPANDISAFEVFEAVYSGGFDPVDRRTTDTMHHVSGIMGRRLGNVVAGSRGTTPLPPATIPKLKLLKVNHDPRTVKAVAKAKRNE